MDEEGLRGVLYLVGGNCSLSRTKRLVAESIVEDRAVGATMNGGVPADELRELVRTYCRSVRDGSQFEEAR